ncbi:MAG TPA: hypothetical protein VNM90_24705 [Haliangium sp.]|nr:hypothetical protein [Haliangium sp.]
MNSQIQQQVNQRIQGFVTEITELAKKAAYETLSAALTQGVPARSGARDAGLGSALRLRSRKGGKRSPDEIAATADRLLQYIRENPGQRMESIATAMSSSTRELALPIKRLVRNRQIQVEGQKRATSYYPATGDGKGRAGKAGRKPQKRAG